MLETLQLEALNPAAFSQAEEPRAHEELYKVCRRVALSVCRSGHGAEYSEDLTQFLALQLLKNGHAVKNPAQLRGWLWETGRRELWRWHKRDRRWAGAWDDEEELPVSESVTVASQEDELVLAAEERQARGFLEELSEKQVLVGALCLTEPAVGQEALAARLGISQPCVCKRKTRFLARCRKFLGQRNHLAAQGLLQALENYLAERKDDWK
jgi:RNA polymerase sigma factor (sigma-70 family)